MITSVMNEKIKQAIKDKNGDFFLAEGMHLVNEAKALGIVKEVFTIDESIEGILVSDNVMRKLCDTSSIVNVCALCYKIIKKELKEKIVILDNVQDPGNVGSIIRTMVSLGYEFLFLGEGCASIYSQKVIRSTQGAIFKINFRSGNITEFLEEITKLGYYIYGTSLSGDALEEIKGTEKMALIFGNEGNGVKKEILEITHKNISIKMQGMESLNVGVAAGIIMYQLRR